MQLTLRSDANNRAAIRLDSALDGFADIARRAARAALANGVVLSGPTRANFAALGIDCDAPGAADTANDLTASGLAETRRNS